MTAPSGRATPAHSIKVCRVNDPLAGAAGFGMKLRKVLAGSRYQINHPTLGYELIVADVPATGTTAQT